MKTRILSMLLVLATAMTLLISCGDAPTAGSAAAPAADTAASADTEEAAETVTDRSQAKDTLPDGLDFEGLEISVLYRGGQNESEITFESLTGDIVNDAVYNRNISVAERLNIKWNFLPFGDANAQSFPANAKSAVLAGSDDYSIFAWAQYSVLPLCLEGLILNIADAAYIDYEQPWWNSAYMDTLQIGSSSRFFLMGDVSLVALQDTAAVFFNQKLYGDAHGDANELYQKVLDGDWTIDVMQELTEEVYEDLNGNGKADTEDRYGVAATTCANTEFFAYGLGLKVIGRDSDDLPTIVVDTERNAMILERLNRFYYENTGMTTEYGDAEFFNQNTVAQVFAADRLMFYPIWLKNCAYLRDMTSDYGVLPYPKFDATQDDYISLEQDTASIFCIPVISAHPEEISAVLEAMCAENYRTVIPAYYDVALKNKYTRDEMSAAMIDLVHDTTLTDFGYAYCYALNEIGTIMRKTVTGKCGMASIYDANAAKYAAGLEQVIASYQN